MDLLFFFFFFSNSQNPTQNYNSNAAAVTLSTYKYIHGQPAFVSHRFASALGGKPIHISTTMLSTVSAAAIAELLMIGTGLKGVCTSAPSLSRESCIAHKLEFLSLQLFSSLLFFVICLDKPSHVNKSTIEN